MKSFVVTLGEFFNLNRGNGAADNFVQNKRRLCIPEYQRPYMWSETQIETLIADVKNEGKFLGMVMLDEADNCYEITDGQQRITTCFLAFMALYNLYEGHAADQKSISNQISIGDEYVLKNDTLKYV
jgi:uncharacterized protein with ParB-like and HNH nuclease domain